ncbi:MAG: hypothetical protein A2144_14790 [Chloroflexi bacterium RBG_16_50_9]|nr:MAG: hypothetical protein A2144_14790 [Chloroflexi bacterium RBG_16_50_9]
MLIIWIRKHNKTGGPTCPQNNDRESFLKHDKDMKEFYLNHPDLNTANHDDIVISGTDVLAAVQKVKLIKHTQN